MNDETIIASGPFNRITPGYRLNAIYVIDSLLATGGMGEVYRGHAIETGDEVAIKTIRPEFAQNTAALALFKKEASALRNLYHEAIVRYFVFSIDKGLPYLAMEYVEGKSLSDFLQKGPLNHDQLRVLQKRLASGLHAAHELGIIHRDVSPDNIILPGENLARAKIIDFGIARSSQGEGTVIGSGFAGKFGYVSPEQLGLFGGDVTGRSDIYSLGLVLAEAALGKPIDMGHSHVEVIDKRRRVPDLSGVEPRIRPLITSMLQPNPKDRPASMAEIAEWTPGGSGGAGRAAKRVGLVAAGLLLVAGAGGAAYHFLPQLSQMLPSGGSPDGSATTPGQQAAAPPDLPAEPPARSAPPSSGSGGLLPGADALLPQAPPVRLEERTPAPPRQPEVAAVSPSQPAPSVPVPAPAPAPLPETRTTPEAGPRPAPSADQVANFLAEYSGGDCFFVAPIQVAAREAKIEAFGSTPAPFISFDDAFQRNMGFEPEISLRQVTAQQCPVVEFLARRTQRSSRPPRLSLRADRLRSGQELSGAVDARGDPNLEILLVADDGLVHNLGAFAKRTGETVNFNLRVEASGAGEKPQLVVAVSSPRPLSTLKMNGPVPADRLFRQLADEARGQVNVSAKYFKLGS
ncbi:MAG: serine/threonine protein kinase [Enterovirga sp.]|nr:serine/threonine protein kinase [Enterovirga sp.]